MILSGLKIKEEIKSGHIRIDPYHENQLNPNSYNLRLSHELLCYTVPVLDVKKPNAHEQFTIPESGLVLRPGTLYLGRTEEFTQTDYYVPMLEGRSSIGRLGLYVHVTAGFGDVGFAGYWTLEIQVVQPVRVYPGIEICQIYYHTIDGEFEKYTNGKYQNNKGIQPSLSWKDFS